MTEHLKKSKHRHPEKDRTNLRLRNLLNIVFITLVVIAVLCYFAFPQQRLIFTIISFIAVSVKGVEVCIRMFAGKKNKND